MRRKQWERALAEIHTTQRLVPSVPGVRLNIALVYYQQNRFDLAIPELESVLRDQLGATLPSYLLALCDVFTERYAASLPLLEKLWDTHSSDLAFLYVFAGAADGAHLAPLETRAISQMMAVGKDSAEVHLYLGKAYLSRQQDEPAQKDFQTAANLNPRLPLVHYFLGAISRRLGNQLQLVTNFSPTSRLSLISPLIMTNPGVVASAVRREIHSLDPTLAIFDAETMPEHLRDAASRSRDIHPCAAVSLGDRVPGLLDSLPPRG